jgi:hypothetical protein
MEIFSSHMKSNAWYDLIAIPRLIYRLVTIKGVLHDDVLRWWPKDSVS